MDGSFEDYKPGFYTVESAQADDFRNKDKSAADLAKWGTAYAVKFKGDAGTYYWSSRTEPQEDQRVYGHVEPSKSGKSMNFRRDEDPNKTVPSSTSKSVSADSKKSEAYLKDISNTPIMMYNGSLHYAKDLGLNLITNAEDRAVYLDYVKDITDEMILWIENIRGGSQESVAHPAPQPIKSGSVAQATSLGDKFRNRQTTNEYSESDIPEEFRG